MGLIGLSGLWGLQELPGQLGFSGYSFDRAYGRIDFSKATSTVYGGYWGALKTLVVPFGSKHLACGQPIPTRGDSA